MVEQAAIDWKEMKLSNGTVSTVRYKSSTRVAFLLRLTNRYPTQASYQGTYLLAGLSFSQNTKLKRSPAVMGSTSCLRSPG